MTVADLKANPLDSNDLRAWVTLAERLEIEVGLQKELLASMTESRDFWRSTAEAKRSECNKSGTEAVLPDDGGAPPSAGRVEAIADHMDSLGAYTQAREVRRLGRAFYSQPHDSGGVEPTPMTDDVDVGITGEVVTAESYRRMREHARALERQNARLRALQTEHVSQQNERWVCCGQKDADGVCCNCPTRAEVNSRRGSE